MLYWELQFLHLQKIDDQLPPNNGGAGVNGAAAISVSAERAHGKGDAPPGKRIPFAGKR